MTGAISSFILIAAIERFRSHPKICSCLEIVKLPTGSASKDAGESNYAIIDVTRISRKKETRDIHVENVSLMEFTFPPAKK